MKRSFTLLLLTTLLSSCNKEKYFDGPNSYEDGFETYINANEMIDGDDEFWSYTQITRDENSLSISSSLAHSGLQSLHCIAAKTDDDGASKCSVAKQKMAFYEGETVEIEAWYYLVGNETLQWLFLMDIEEQAAIGAGPGIRIAVVDNALLVEHKYPNPNIEQDAATKIDFPRDEWVKVTLEIKLSQKKKGYIKLYQNNDLVIHQDNWKTLPTDLLYFQQGTKGMYSSIEFGITANSFSNAAELYVDDISCRLK